MYMTTLLLHPKSTGTIRLSGPSHEDEPLIDPKFLHHPDDARTLKEGRAQLYIFGLKLPEFNSRR